jgi:predicted methyltransferase MtxX (methanogen marker protein 4)
MALGFIIELLVASLLVVTIVYCVILNGKLKSLKSDESTLRETIAELMDASDAAERAIGELRQIAAECDETLGARLRRAGDLRTELDQMIDEGQDIVRRLSLITAAARGGRIDGDGPTVAEAAAVTAARLSEYGREARKQAVA